MQVCLVGFVFARGEFADLHQEAGIDSDSNEVLGFSGDWTANPLCLA